MMRSLIFISVFLLLQEHLGQWALRDMMHSVFGPVVADIGITRAVGVYNNDFFLRIA